MLAFDAGAHRCELRINRFVSAQFDDADIGFQRCNIIRSARTFEQIKRLQIALLCGFSGVIALAVAVAQEHIGTVFHCNMVAVFNRLFRPEIEAFPVRRHAQTVMIHHAQKVLCVLLILLSERRKRLKCSCVIMPLECSGCGRQI